MASAHSKNPRKPQIVAAKCGRRVHPKVDHSARCSLPPHHGGGCACRDFDDARPALVRNVDYIDRFGDES